VKRRRTNSRGKTVRRLPVLVICFLGLSGLVFGQQEIQSASYSIDEVRAPDSPALTVLDVAATSVERPNTPRALAATVLSAAERSEGSFPQDLLITAGPF
jgi:hypothetical protein